MALEDILLRISAQAPLTTKGSELKQSEIDNNWIVIYNELASMGAAGMLEIYDAGTEYSANGASDPDYVVHDSKIWEFVSGTDQTGVTPGTNPAVWSRVTAGALVHQRNRDTKLAEGTANEVTAAELAGIVDCRLPALFPVDDVVDGAVAVPVSPEGGVYLLEDQTALDIDSITWQSGTDVDYEFNSLADISSYLVDGWLHVDSAEKSSNDGSFLITNILGQTVTVTNPNRTDATDDEGGSPVSTAKGKFTHADWDGAEPSEHVKYNATDDEWLATPVIEGDKVYDKTTETTLKFNGTTWETETSIIHKKVTLTSAQIKAINTSPVELVPAPGAGKMIELTSVIGRLNYGTVDYVLAGGDIGVYETDSAGTLLTSFLIAFNPFLDRSADEIRQATLVAQSAALTLLENKALVATVDTGDPITGDSTFDLYISYRVLTL